MRTFIVNDVDVDVNVVDVNDVDVDVDVNDVDVVHLMVITDLTDLRTGLVPLQSKPSAVRELSTDNIPPYRNKLAFIGEAFSMMLVLCADVGVTRCTAGLLYG